MRSALCAFLLSGLLGFAQTPPSPAPAPSPLDDPTPRVLVVCSNGSIDPRILDGTLPQPKPGTQAWATFNIQLMGGLVASRIASGIKGTGADCINVSIPEGPAPFTEAVGAALVRERKNRILNVRILTRRDGPKPGIWVEVRLMGLRKGDTGPTGTKATLTDLWEGELEFDLQANTDPKVQDSPLTVAAKKVGDAFVATLKGGGFLAAPQPPSPGN
jgi:hypothetical protein